MAIDPTIFLACGMLASYYFSVPIGVLLLTVPLGVVNRIIALPYVAFQVGMVLQTYFNYELPLITLAIVVSTFTHIYYEYFHENPQPVIYYEANVRPIIHPVFQQEPCTTQPCTTQPVPPVPQDNSL